MVLNTPEHEEDTSDDCEDERVGEVTVEGELHHVAAEAKCSSGLHQSGKYPPADRTERNWGSQMVPEVFERETDLSMTASGIPAIIVAELISFLGLTILSHASKDATKK